MKTAGAPTIIQYISHGARETGGYAHEKFLAASLSETICGSADTFREIRFRSNFKGPFRWFLLALKAFFAADRQAIVVTVARLAWPIRLKQVFGKGKIVLVLHNYDSKDGKPRLYYRLLNAFMKYTAKNPQKACVVVVARYWQDFLKDRFGVAPILFPNFFDAKTLQVIAHSARKNPKLIHFGMYSDKIYFKKYLILFHLLKEHGFVCYFSFAEPVFSPDLPVSTFQDHGEYLKQVAGSVATVILNKTNEGWNRVAHESVLLGTPVIASAGGGLEELVRLSGGIISDSPKEIVGLINAGLPQICFDNSPFEPAARSQYLEKIVSFIQQ